MVLNDVAVAGRVRWCTPHRHTEVVIRGRDGARTNGPADLKRPSKVSITNVNSSHRHFQNMIAHSSLPLALSARQRRVDNLLRRRTESPPKAPSQWTRSVGFGARMLKFSASSEPSSADVVPRNTMFLGMKVNGRCRFLH